MSSLTVNDLATRLGGTVAGVGTDHGAPGSFPGAPPCPDHPRGRQRAQLGNCSPWAYPRVERGAVPLSCAGTAADGPAQRRTARERGCLPRPWGKDGDTGRD